MRSNAVALPGRPSHSGGVLMGDKSPKAKERQKKQDTTHKNELKAAAISKAKPVAGPVLKSGK